MTKRKRGYSRWSDEEEDALRLGVEVYGEGKWKRILTDAALAKYFVDRSNVDLKDKWRTMLCADKGTTRSAQALPEAEGGASVENSSGAYTSPQDIPDSCDSASKQMLPKAPEHRTSHQASMVIPPVSSQSDKALKSALEAAKRRHNGTSGDRAQVELQLELLTEVLKAVAAHESSHLLGGSELSSLQGRLSLLRSSGSSRPARTPARFFRDLLGLLQPPELSELRAFAIRQFEVLCLVDDACRRSLLPALSASSISPSISSPHAPPKLSFHATHAQEPKPMRASARQAAKHAHHGARGLQQKQQQRQHEVEDLRELLAVDALTMIREGSSSGDGSRGGGTSHEAPGDEEICSPRGRSPSRPSPHHAPASAPTPAAPAPVQQQPTSPSKPSAPLPLRPASPSVSVPEGCGLDSTCVSAAMDKASELLNQCSAQDLLPVRDLGIHQPCSTISSAATANADYGHVTHQQQPPQPQQRQHQQHQPMQSAPFALVPTSALPILSPLALADKALPSVLKSGLLPAGAEAWYPAYMAWVYSGLVHSGVR